MPAHIAPGLCSTARSPLLRRGRVALLTHPAAVDTSGRHASLVLREALGQRLVALLGPEHGFFGRGGAGERIGDARHPAWYIPIHSLYGDQRKPTPAMLDEFDTIVFDLQDLGVRCYTFVSTLRLVMEACAEAGKRMIVLDRPLPPLGRAEGPLPKSGFESFVAGVPMPYVYDLTPGEAALFLQRWLKIPVDLRVVPVRGWKRGDSWPAGLPWISPSPGIRYPETAAVYPITVVFEAFPHIDLGRGSTEPFQVFSAPWIDAEELAATLNRRELPGLRFHPCYRPDPGIRVQAHAPRKVRAFAAAVHVLDALQRLFGDERLWGGVGVRPEWLDKLFATDAVRLALRDGTPARDIVAGFESDRRAFVRDRGGCLLYGDPS